MEPKKYYLFLFLIIGIFLLTYYTSLYIFNKFELDPIILSLISVIIMLIFLIFFIYISYTLYVLIKKHCIIHSNDEICKHTLLKK